MKSSETIPSLKESHAVMQSIDLHIIDDAIDLVNSDNEHGMDSEYGSG